MGRAASTRSSRREGRLLLAAAAVALGDRRLLDAAPAGAARAGRGRGRRARQARPRRTSRSTTSATTRTRTAGSSTRCRKRPGVVVLHEYVLHHLIAGITIGRGDGRGYLDAMERELGVAGRLLGLGVLDNLLPLLWETQPERFPLSRRRARPRARADRALRVRRRRARAQPATRGGSGGSRIPRGPPDDRACGRCRRRAADRLLRLPEHEQADPAAARGVRVAPPKRCPGARLLLVGAAAERFDVERRLERLGLTEGVQRARLRSRGAHVVADGGLRRARQSPLPDDGRDVGLA